MPTGLGVWGERNVHRSGASIRRIMAIRPPKICGYPGCPATKLIVKGRCPLHQRQTWRQQDERRGSSSARGYDSRWRKASKAFLRRQENLFCRDPFGDHKPSFVMAQCVDHIVAHKGDPMLFWDQSNWQSLCLRCNSKKSILYEKGFGRQPLTG